MFGKTPEKSEAFLTKTIYPSASIWVPEGIEYTCESSSSFSCHPDRSIEVVFGLYNSTQSPASKSSLDL